MIVSEVASREHQEVECVSAESSKSNVRPVEGPLKVPWICQIEDMSVLSSVEYIQTYSRRIRARGLRIPSP